MRTLTRVRTSTLLSAKCQVTSRAAILRAVGLKGAGAKLIGGLNVSGLAYYAGADHLLCHDQKFAKLAAQGTNPLGLKGWRCTVNSLVATAIERRSAGWVQVPMHEKLALAVCAYLGLQQDEGNVLVLAVELRRGRQYPDDLRDGVLANLSQRRREVARLLIITSCSYKEIGTRLGISYNTVRTHVANIYRYAGVHSRLGLIEVARARKKTGRYLGVAGLS